MATGLYVETMMNNAKLLTGVQEVKNAIRSMHEDVKKSGASFIDNLNKSWIGWTMKIYMAEKAIRMLGNSFGELYQPVEEFNLSVTAMAAQVTNMMEKGPNTDIAAQYAEAKTYALDLARTMEQVDAETLASAKDLRAMNEVMIANNVALDVYNQKEVDAFKNIANAVAVIASLSPNKDIQVRQEIGALMRGEVKTGDQLAKQIQAMVDGPLAEEVKKHKEIGDLTQWYGNLLRGYSAASQDIETTWAAIGTSLKTAWDIIARTGFSQGYQDINSALKDMNVWLRENSGVIANGINIGWEATKGLVLIARDVVMVFKEEIVASGYAMLELAKGVITVIELLPNLAHGAKNIATYFAEAWKFAGGAIAYNMGFRKSGMAQMDESEQRMWQVMMEKRNEDAEHYMQVLKWRLENIINPPESRFAYEVADTSGLLGKGVPKLGKGYSKDTEAQKRADEYKSLWENMDKWADTVQKSNPWLTALDKALVMIDDELTDHIRKIGESKHLTEDQKDALESWAKGIHAQSRAFAIYNDELATENRILEYSDKLLEERIKKEFDMEKVYRAEDNALKDLITDLEKRRIAEEASFLGKTKAWEATAQYNNEMKKLQDRIRSLNTSGITEGGEGGYAVADPEKMEEVRQLQIQINKLTLEYQSLMSSMDVAIDAWEKQHEVLNSIREALGITNKELLQGSVDTWQMIGQAAGDVTKTITDGISDMVMEWVNGTLDMKTAAQKMAESILKTMINMMMQIYAKQMVLGLMGLFQGIGTGAQAGYSIQAIPDTTTVPVVQNQAALSNSSYSVTVINNTDKQVSTQQKPGVNGPSLEIVVDNMVASKLNQWGSLSNKTIRQNFDTSPRLVNR